MPWRYPAYQVKDIAVSQQGPGNLCVWASDGYWWLHCNFSIHVSSKINTCFVTTFKTPKEEVPVTLSPYINGSSCLVRICNELFAQPRTNYLKIFLPYSYLRKRDGFHPSVVVVCWLIHRQCVYLLSGISPKHIGQLSLFLIFFL